MSVTAEEVSVNRSVEIGERIIQARKELGMKQVELAELIHVAERTMQAYESGEVVPWRKLRDLERILDRPIAWFLHGDAGHDDLRETNVERNELLTELVGLCRQILEEIRKA